MAVCVLWSFWFVLLSGYSCVIGDELVSVQEFRLLQQKFEEMVFRLENQNAQIQSMTQKMKSLENSNCSCANVYKEHKRLLLVEPQGQVISNVAFSTRLTKAMSGLGNHQTVVFDQVITDTSSAYNANDGIFSTPVSGMYVFTWTIGVTATHYIGTELVIDSVMYGYSYADGAQDGDYDYGSATQTVVVKVQKGQHVWIRREHGSGGIDGVNNKPMDSTFSGWMLYPLE